MGHFYSSVEGGHHGLPPKFPSSRGLGQDFVKRWSSEGSPGRGIQRTASLITDGLQAACTGAVHPKIPPETGRNGRPGGMRPVFLAEVPQAVILRAGQDAGISPPGDGTQTSTHGSSKHLHPFFFPSPGAYVVYLLSCSLFPSCYFSFLFFPLLAQHPFSSCFATFFLL